MIKKIFKITAIISILLISLVFASCSKTEETVLQTTTQTSVATTSSTSEDLDNPDLYSTDSSKNLNFSFICPKDWSIIEEEDFTRVVLKNKEENETIIVSIEELKSENLETDYMNIGEEINISEIKDIENIKINNKSVPVAGYEYLFGNEENLKAVDLFTFIKEGENTCMIKYSSLNIKKEDAIKSLKDFCGSFILEKNSKGLKKADDNKSMNILILGDDSGMGREGGRVSGRTDIMIIMHVNLEKHEGTIVTIPRDTWAAIPDHGENKINSAHAFGGMELTIKTIEELSGLTIDNYIITDMDGFPALIDYFGGVTVEVEEDLSDGFSGCYLEKGTHHINGEQALALARNRHRNGGAFAREKEAAKIVMALYDQNRGFETLIRLPAFLNIMLKYTWTDLKFNDFIYLISVFGKIEASDINITTIPSWPEMVGNASAVVYDKDATRELFEEIKEQ